MNDFTASNGMHVLVSGNGSAMVAHPLGSSKRLERREFKALQEQIVADRDASLRRWRWPQNPDYVVYAQPDEAFERMFGPGLDLVILRESDGMTKGYVRAEDQGIPPAAHRVDHMLAARAYFDAHPEPKPWHDAKPGEIWALGIGGGYHGDSITVVEVDGEPRFIWHVGGENGLRNIPVRDRSIDYGRRVWPVVAS